MTPHTPPLATRIVRATVFAAAGILLLLAMPASATPDNQGTIKVHEAGSLGDESNDPHVVCSFYVEGFNMQASSGSLVIDQHAPTGSANVVTTTWTANDVVGDGFADHHFLNGPFSLAAGHYKVFVGDEQHDKMKTFWVDPCQSSSSTTSTSETTTSTSQTETTTNEIPFFPSGTSMGLGALGAAVAGVLMLRRRI
jgi:hypothetical protein